MRNTRSHQGNCHIGIKSQVNCNFVPFKWRDVTRIVFAPQKERNVSERNIHKLAIIVGKNVARRRKEIGLKQAELAELIGIGADSLSRLEKGLIAPRFSRLEQISEHLTCSVADFFRSPGDEDLTRANEIVEILKVLPPDKQEEVVDLVRRIVQFGNVGQENK